MYFGLITQKEAVAVSEVRKDMGRTGRCGGKVGIRSPIWDMLS